MARFSEKGWTSDFDPNRMTSDQIDRYVDGLRDDMRCRHDGGAKPKRLRGPAGYLSSYGMTDLIKHDYTLDLERAKAGDKEAAERIARAKREGCVPIGVAIAEELGQLAMYKVAAKKREEMARAAEVAAALKEFNQRKSTHVASATGFEDLISRLEKDYYSGYFLAAIEISSMYLSHPNFNIEKFELARDWMNKARRNRQIDIGLLRKFREICQKHPLLRRDPEHGERYQELIERFQRGEFQNWFCIELVHQN